MPADLGRRIETGVIRYTLNPRSPKRKKKKSSLSIIIHNTTTAIACSRPRASAQYQICSSVWLRLPSLPFPANVQSAPTAQTSSQCPSPTKGPTASNVARAPLNTSSPTPSSQGGRTSAQRRMTFSADRARGTMRRRDGCSAPRKGAMATRRPSSRSRFGVPMSL